MQQVEFEIIKKNFETADTDEKIRLYTQTQGLNKDQYLELLRSYPVNELKKLEKALQ